MRFVLAMVVLCAFTVEAQAGHKRGGSSCANGQCGSGSCGQALFPVPVNQPAVPTQTAVFVPSTSAPLVMGEGESCGQRVRRGFHPFKRRR